LFALLLLANQGVAADQLDDLLRKVPDRANTVVVIEREAILRSPLAARLGWAKKSEADYLAGISAIPPGASKLVFAAQLVPGSLGSSWVIGLMQMKNDVSIAEVARREKHSVDNLAGFPVVLCPRDAYFVEMGPRLVGTMHPANRQELARWLRSIKRSSQPTLTPYLQQAVGNGSDQSQIVLAIDTLDMVDTKEIRAHLGQSKVLAGQNVELDAAAKVLAGLRGLRLVISINDGIHGELHLDFADSITPIAPFVKPLLLETLDHMGAALDQLGSWNAAPADTSAVLTGTLSPRTLRQVLSFFHTPPPTQGFESVRQPEIVPPPGDPKAVASQRYFRSIQTMLNDLAEIKSKTYIGIAYWYEKYAKDIDQFPMLNVDPELLNYGLGVSVMLRSIAGSLRGAPIQNELLDQYKGQASFSTPGYYNYRVGPGYAYAWGYPGSYWEVNNYNEVIRAQSQAAAAGNEARKTAWNLVLEKTNIIRQRMVVKYHVEFGSSMSTTGGSQLRTIDK